LTLKLVNVRLPVGQIKKIDAIVATKFFPNRSEVIREAIRLLIQNEVELGHVKL